MHLRFTIRDLFLACLLIVCIGCGRNATAPLIVPQKMTIYATDIQTDQPDIGQGRFHGYPILGKVEIEDANQRAEIMIAVNKSFEEGKGLLAASCFWPRHAIHTETDGKTTDYVICFECLQATINDEGRFPTISRSAEPVLTKYLTDAGIK